MNIVQAVIASVLRDPKSPPILQFQTLRVLKLLIIRQLAKDCIETFNDDFIT
jgi:hypothetical protein